MSNELIHSSVGTSLTQAEFEAVGLHVLNSQATGDLIYASSASQLSRLGITNSRILVSSGGVPSWSATLPAVTLGGTVTGAAQILSNLGTCYIGDTSNANATLGLTINQGAADNEAFAIKSSDVAHAYITGQETDTFYHITKASGDYGGVVCAAFMEDNAAQDVVLSLRAFGGQANATKSTASVGLVDILVAETDGAGALANITANGNVLGVRAYVSGAYAARMLLDEDGDLWLNGGLTGTTLTMSGACDCGTSCEANAYTVGGVSGVDFNGAVTNLTVVKGIVTAAS